MVSAPVVERDAVTTDSSDDVGLNHIYCDCDPDRALCGLDVSDLAEDDKGSPCIVCYEMERYPCERCGW